MSMHEANPADRFLTRRELLHACGMSFGALAFSQLFEQTARAQDKGFANPLAAKPPHFTPKVKRVVHLFMNGGPSQVDTFDPKPMLRKYDGKPLPTGNLGTERLTGAALPSPFSFKKYGK